MNPLRRRGRTPDPAGGRTAPALASARTHLPLILVGFLGVAALLATALLTGPSELRRVSDQRSDPVLERPMKVGVTHAQYSADPWNPNASNTRAEKILRATSPVQNQHLMGWGVGNPEPSPGVYDWASLDRRMALIKRTGGAPVITLCGAPDWMKGGQAGRTEWAKLSVAPLPAHYRDFAELSAATARRYPEVTHFAVWNELKGFWDSRRGRWDIENYTRLYNEVYDALKAVNPGIKVGGPYVVADSFASAKAMSHPSNVAGPWGVIDQRTLDAVQYWLDHAHGADFITVDGGTATRDRGLIVDDVAATEKFAAMTRWLRSRTSLPIWWMELYPEVDNRWLWAGAPERAAVAMEALVRLNQAGAATVLIWQPQASAALPSVALWTDALPPAGARELPLAKMMTWLNDSLSAGRTPAISWSGGIATVHDGKGTLLVNSTGVTAQVTCAGVTLPVLWSVEMPGAC